MDASIAHSALRVFIVDDEALARSRLRTLLSGVTKPQLVLVGEAGNAVQAMTALQKQPCDVVLLDIQMPGGDGLALARGVRELAHPPALVFITAHAEHAVQAFEVDAVDYLTKPVRQERLQAALAKAERFLSTQRVVGADGAIEESVLIQERGRSERVPLREVVYFKAELKYITVRTTERTYILDGSLNDLEERYASLFVRIHRNALIARRAVRALEKHFDSEEGAEGWAVRLDGVAETLAVSRRQLPAVRALMSG